MLDRLGRAAAGGGGTLAGHQPCVKFGQRRHRQFLAQRQAPRLLQPRALLFDGVQPRNALWRLFGHGTAAGRVQVEEFAPDVGQAGQLDRPFLKQGIVADYDSGSVVEAACWAHARRKFYDLHAARPSPLITEALRRICELYAIEESIRGMSPDVRLAERGDAFRPQLACTAATRVRRVSSLPMVSAQARAASTPLTRKCSWKKR